MAHDENRWRNQTRDWREQERWRNEDRSGRLYDERDYAGPLRGNQFRDEERGYGQGFGRGGYGRLSERDYAQRDVSPRNYDQRDFGPQDYGGRGYRDRGDVISHAEARRDWYRDRDNPFGGEQRGYRSDYRRDNDRGFFDRAGDEISSWFGDEDAERRRQRDAQQGDSLAQHHRGRGPRGYTRSDDRIREDVNDRLTDDPYIDASEIDVSVSNGEITLSGTVHDRNTKRRAEDLAEAISGVRHVQNNLRVQQQTQGVGGTSAGASAMAGMGSTGMGAGGTGSTGTGAGGSGQTDSTSTTPSFGSRVNNRT